MSLKKFTYLRKSFLNRLPFLSPIVLLVLLLSTPALGAPLSLFLSTEFGPDDFQVSVMNPAKTTGYEALKPSVAYNTTRDDFLVVWGGPNQHRTFGYWYTDREIWYQQVDQDGGLIGVNRKLTQIGGYDDYTFHARNPDVAYNPFRNEFIVVWEDNGRECGDDKKYDIAGQRLYYDGDGNLSPIGAVKEISIMGPRPINCFYHAYNPAVVYNWINQEYMVVWEGSHNSGDLESGEFEIWGQRLNAATLDRVGDMVRISYMGPDGNTSYDAKNPDIDFNRYPTYNEYLVVWEGDTNSGSFVNEEFEIWSERISASGIRLGTLVMSDAGGVGNDDYNAKDPAVVYNSNKNRWLVVWYGDDSSPGDGKYEIFGQQVKYNASGNLVGVGPNDFRISHLGSDGTSAPDAYFPAVTYDITSNFYIVVWQDRDDAPGADWYEIHGQRILDEPTSAVAPHGFQISEMGPPTNHNYFARRPAIASSSYNGFLLAVWEGTDPTYTGINDWEIFGQLFYSLADTFLPVIFKN